MASVVVILAAVSGMGTGVGAGAEPVTTTTAAPPISVTTTTGAPTTTTSAPIVDPSTTTTSEPESSGDATTSVPGETTTTTSTVPGTLTPPSTISSDRIDAMRAASSDYEDATAEEADVFKRYIDAQQQAIDLSGQVDQLNTQVGAIQHDLDQAQAAVQTSALHVLQVSNRLRDAEDQLGQEQDRLRAQAVEAYIGGGAAGGNASANAVMRSGTVDDLGKTIVYADAVVGDQRTTVARVSDLRATVEGLQAEAKTARDDAVRARDEVDGRKKALEAQRDQQATAQRAVADLAATQQQLLVEVAAKREQYAARLAALSHVSDGISATLKNAEAGQSLPPVLTGIFLSPIPNPHFNSPFGPRGEPLAGMHNGVDINGTTGTPIRAPADGVVLIAGDVSGYGNCTVIDHGSGLGTLYGHQSEFAVKVGDIVKRGQVIGYVGSTGHSTGPHLHWEVREFGQPFDPVPFIGPG